MEWYKKPQTPVPHSRCGETRANKMGTGSLSLVRDPLRKIDARPPFSLGFLSQSAD
jgi:hypothetical protein